MSTASIHEDFNRKEAIKGSSDRSFGFVFTIFFALVALWPLVHKRPVRWWGLGLSGAFLAITLIRPSVLHPLNWLWTRLGLLLHSIVTPIVTGVLFYVVITPIALLFRMQGKDLLRMKTDPGATSYWIARVPPGPKPETMSNQF